MDQKANVWLVVHSGLDQEDKRKKRKEKKGGSCVWLPVFHSRQAGSQNHETVLGVLTTWLREAPWVSLLRKGLGVGDSSTVQKKGSSPLKDRASEVAQLVEHLPSTHRALGCILNIPKTRLTSEFQFSGGGVRRIKNSRTSLAI